MHFLANIWPRYLGQTHCWKLVNWNNVGQTNIWPRYELLTNMYVGHRLWVKALSFSTNRLLQLLSCAELTFDSSIPPPVTRGQITLLRTAVPIWPTLPSLTMLCHSNTQNFLFLSSKRMPCTFYRHLPIPGSYIDWYQYMPTFLLDIKDHGI